MSYLTPQIPAAPDGIIEMEVFNQIREMDEVDEDDEDGDEDPHEFSRGIIFGYFEQAEATFKEMEEAM
jgi:osomolarity two-component system phosphorelay intermediate protein YPD1